MNNRDFGNKPLYVVLIIARYSQSKNATKLILLDASSKASYKCIRKQGKADTIYIIEFGENAKKKFTK